MSTDNFIVVEPTDDRPNHGSWAPIVGPEGLDFLERVVPEPSRTTIGTTAVEILSRGVSPTSNSGQETGLIVGYVQSGKTMSFEAVTALGRDNGFQIVVVVAGSATNLLDQSAGRLAEDLRLNDPGRSRRWVQFQNPRSDDATIQAIRDVLQDWRDPTVPENYRRTVLITVLKQHQRLQTLASLFSAVGVQGGPVLVIDDEADQASLNAEVAQGLESTTYNRLMRLRAALPLHSYFQYTATPQAPLLINIIDSLSPNFVQVLPPGADYVGGREFFASDSNVAKLIPPADVPTRTNPLNSPPDSLIEALRVFMLGVSAGIITGGNTGNRSMLVHPSHRTAQHQEFYGWVRDIFEEWKRVFALPDGDMDRQDLVEDFSSAYSDLSDTVGADLPDFNKLMNSLLFAFRNTRVLEVNARAGRTPQVDWKSAYGWILVGGQAMDRGFTVKGLTVTYMPRGIGVGNADSIQQRARFFGYKRQYFGYCRVYIELGTLNAFQRYVEHEEDIRTQLKCIQDEGRSLNEWKRAFVLDNALRPCRHHVIEFDYIQGRFANEWVSPRVVVAAPNILHSNRLATDRFVSQFEFTEDDGHPERTSSQRHIVCRDVDLARVLDELLVQIRIVGPLDSQRNTGMLLQLAKALEDHPQENCTILRMSPNERRRRGVDQNGEVTNIYQGEAPVHPIGARGSVYPGDRKIRDESQVTIQIHRLDLTREGNVVAEDVVVLAVWIPGRLARAWLSQEQPFQVE